MYHLPFEAYYADSFKVFDRDNFTIKLSIIKKKLSRENVKGVKKVPQFKLTLDEYMPHKTLHIAQSIFNFEESSFFDRPSAMRLLTGVMRTANDYAANHANSVYMNLKDENLNVLLDCNIDSALQMDHNPISSNLFEYPMSQNVMEFLYPKYYEIQLEEMINSNEEVKDNLAKLGLNNEKGKITFTSDPFVLSQLSGHGSFVKPGFDVVPSDKYDGLKIKKMDLV